MIPEGYDLDEQISATVFSQVWRARNMAGEPVVLKLAPSATDKLHRFQREIAAMQAARGPHTMPVLDHDDTFSWYAMPLARRTLAFEQVPVELPVAVAVVDAIAVALRPIHAVGQVHRDLKPQNILWLDDGLFARWVVADFGIVRSPRGETTAELTRAGSLLGTDGWAAPELHRTAHDATVAADVYGAGAILSWLLTGVHPAGGVELPTDPALRAIMRRAADPIPARRHADLDALMSALTALSTSGGARIDVLVAAHDYVAIGPYVLGHPAHLPDAVDVLTQLDRAAVGQWQGVDPGGLHDAAEYLLTALATDRRGISYSTIDRFLSWGITVVRAQLAAQRHEDAEELAITLFSAIADIHQFEPARFVLDFLDGLNDREQSVMESALYASTGLDFFRDQAASRWRTSRTSRLVRDLME